MSDRELLERAAKAYGFKEPTFEDGAWLELRYGLTVAIWDKAEDGGEGYWNPLESDGQAIRLSNRLGLLISAHVDEAWAQFYRLDTGWSTFKEPCGEEKNAAMRRVIVRAAAEIGRSMG
jgi:hypothetical protein